jgi:hypothetical protein
MLLFPALKLLSALADRLGRLTARRFDNRPKRIVAMSNSGGA